MTECELGGVTVCAQNIIQLLRAPHVRHCAGASLFVFRQSEKSIIYLQMLIVFVAIAMCIRYLLSTCGVRTLIAVMLL